MFICSWGSQSNEHSWNSITSCSFSRSCTHCSLDSIIIPYFSQDIYTYIPYYYMRICYWKPICLLFTSFFNSHFFPNIPIPQPSLLPASRPLSSPSTSFYAHDGWPPPCFTLPSCISLIHSSFIALLSDIYSLYLLPPFWHFGRFLSLMNTNTAFL